MCVCSINYQARNVHAPYCFLWPAPLYNMFPLYLTNGWILEKKVLDTKCVLVFSTAFVRNISLSKKKWARYDKYIYIGLHVKSLLFWSDFNGTWIFLDIFSKNPQISNLMEIRPVRVELYRADRQTDRHDEDNSPLFAILRTRLKYKFLKCNGNTNIN